MLYKKENDNVKELYEIIEPSGNESSKWSSVYDIAMLICIITSMILLAIKPDGLILSVINKITVPLFAIF